MRTYTNNLIAEHGILVGMGYAAGNGHKATTAKGENTLVKHVKNVALFLAAPFIGLAYIVAFPFVGLSVIAHSCVRLALGTK